jgi:hypothetical protein
MLNEIDEEIIQWRFQRLTQELKQEDISILEQTVQKEGNQIDFAVFADVHPSSENFLIKQIYDIVSKYAHIITMKKSGKLDGVYIIATSFY